MILTKSVLLCAAVTMGVSLPGWAQGPAGAYPGQQFYYPQSAQPYYPQSSQPYYQQPQPYSQPQGTYQQPPAPATAALTPQDLTNLVAPVALYPDMLLSQILAASTYPAEITQAEQWVQSNPNLSGPQLVDAAKQQPWDPSVQALVAFPDVLARLAGNIQWTTDLGNAFLSQQAAVMDAIQQLRASARNNGRLQDTPQQRVTVDPGAGDYGQNAIVIQPTNPQVVYAPVYNPEYVWGPPVYGAYPALVYPAPGLGIAYGVGTFLGGLFSGLLSFGGWGWGLSWLTHGLFLNGLFFNHFGFHGVGGFGGPGYGAGYGAHVAWVHNPSHRLGVPYGNRFAGNGFGGRGFSAGNYRGGYSGGAYGAGRNFAANSGYRSGSSFASGNRQAEAYRGLTGRSSGFGNSYASGYRGSGGVNYSQARYSAPAYGASRSYGGGYGNSGYGNSYGASHAGQGFQGSSRGSYSEGSARGFSGGGRSFSEPHYSASNFSASNHSASNHFSGHSGGGGEHGHSGGGGGHSHGGGGSHKK